MVCLQARCAPSSRGYGRFDIACPVNRVHVAVLVMVCLHARVCAEQQGAGQFDVASPVNRVHVVA